MVLTPPTIQTVQSYRVGAPHIGFGIYFDWEKIQTTLSTADQELMKDPLTNRKKIVERMTRLLSGGNGGEAGKDGRIDWGSLVLNPLKTRFASEYLNPEIENRGVCRQKALILHKILQQLGIRSELKWATAKDPDSTMSFDHAFVFIPEEDLIADPMNHTVNKAADYRNLLQVTNERDFSIFDAFLSRFTP